MSPEAPGSISRHHPAMMWSSNSDRNEAVAMTTSTSSSCPSCQFEPPTLPTTSTPEEGGGPSSNGNGGVSDEPQLSDQQPARNRGEWPGNMAAGAMCGVERSRAGRGSGRERRRGWGYRMCGVYLSDRMGSELDGQTKVEADRWFGLRVPDPKQMQQHNQGGHHQAEQYGGGVGASSSKPVGPKPEMPRIYTTLSRKEKEEDFLAMKGTKLPQRPKKRPKNVDKAVNFICPGMWLTDVTRSKYVVREKKCPKKQKHRGLKGMESMDSDSD